MPVHCLAGGFSGGTVATMSKAMHTKPEQYRAQLDYDPLLKDREGKKSERKVTPLMSNAVRYSSRPGCWEESLFPVGFIARF